MTAFEIDRDVADVGLDAATSAVESYGVMGRATHGPVPRPFVGVALRHPKGGAATIAVMSFPGAGARNAPRTNLCRRDHDISPIETKVPN